MQVTSPNGPPNQSLSIRLYGKHTTITTCVILIGFKTNREQFSCIMFDGKKFCSRLRRTLHSIQQQQQQQHLFEHQHPQQTQYSEKQYQQSLHQHQYHNSRIITRYAHPYNQSIFGIINNVKHNINTFLLNSIASLSVPETVSSIHNLTLPDISNSNTTLATVKNDNLSFVHRSKFVSVSTMSSTANINNPNPGVMQVSGGLKNYSSYEELELLNIEWQIVLVMVYSLTAAIALFGNVIAIWVLMSGKRSSKELRLFLVNLSLADITMALFSIPFTYTDFMLGRWIFAPMFCPIVQLMQMTSVFVSVYTLTAIGIDR